jgi:ankyrin repeat protein
MKSIRAQLLVTLLATAVAAGMLIYRGPPPEKLLWRAVLDNDARQVRRILKWTSDADSAWWPMCETPMRFAISLGHKEVVVALLGSPNGLTRLDRPAEGFPPVWFAASLGNREMLEFLIANGAKVNAPDPFGRTGLHVAAGEGRADIVTSLLERKADVHAKDKYGQTPLHRACTALTPNKEIVGLLVTRGAETSVTDEKGKTPLYYAERKGWTEIAALLRRHGALE